MPGADKKLILIVDDTPTNIAVVSGLLKDSFQTKVATNGEKALAIATGAEKPDLILLDVMMPGMDGYEVCRKLKDNPATRDIPVIFLTAKTEEIDEEKGFDVGAVDYIHKPFSGPIVLARVRTQLALQEALSEAREARKQADQQLLDEPLRLRPRDQGAPVAAERQRAEAGPARHVRQGLATDPAADRLAQRPCHPGLGLGVALQEYFRRA